MQNYGTKKYLCYDDNAAGLRRKDNWDDYNCVVRIIKASTDNNTDNNTFIIKQVCTNTYFQALSGNALQLGESAENIYTLSPATSIQGNTNEGAFLFKNGSNYIHQNQTEHPIGYSGNGQYSNWNIFKVDVTEATTKVKYVISDATEVVYTSDFYIATPGETISDLPNDVKRPFCSYNIAPHEIAAGENTVNVTVTYNLPFNTDAESRYYAALRERYLYYNETSTEVLSSTDGEHAEQREAYQWQFIGNPYSGIKVKHVGTGKYLKDDGGNKANLLASNEAEAESYIIYRPNEDSNIFGLMYAGNNKYVHVTIQQNGSMNYYGFDEGAQWKIVSPEEVTEVTYNVEGFPNHSVKDYLAVVGSAPHVPESLNYDYTTYTYNVNSIGHDTETITATPHFETPFECCNKENPVWYCLRNDPSKSDFFIYTNGTATAFSNQVGKSGNAYLWAFIGNPIEGIKLLNKAEGKYLTDSSTPFVMTADIGDAKSWRVKRQTTNFDNGRNWFLLYSETNTNYANTRSGNLGYYTEPGNYSSFWVETTEESYDRFAGKLTEIEGLIDEGLGKYSFGDEYKDRDADEFENYDEKFVFAVDKYNSAHINLPKPQTFLRIKGETSHMYISSEIGAGNTNYVMIEEPDLSTIFYFDGTRLLNYSTGLYNGMTKDGNTTNGRTKGWGWMIGEEAASEVEFLDGETNGGYGIKSGVTDSYAYMFDNGDGEGSNNLGVDRAESYGADARYRSWTLEEVTDLPVKMNAVGSKYYGTLCLPVGVEIKETQAYIPALEENKLVCDEPTTEIPANTPVILIGESQNATATITTVATTKNSGNPLSGTIGKISNPGGDVFVLSAINGSAGFYKYVGENIPGFKAYYYVAGDNSATSNGFIISFGDDDDLTGIAEVENAADAAAYYDLQGRRVIAPQRGQLYIVNGKKVLY